MLGQWCEEDKPLLVVYNLISILTSLISVQGIYEEWDIPINVHRHNI